MGEMADFFAGKQIERWGNDYSSLINGGEVENDYLPELLSMKETDFSTKTLKDMSEEISLNRLKFENVLLSEENRQHNLKVEANDDLIAIFNKISEPDKRTIIKHIEYFEKNKNSDEIITPKQIQVIFKIFHNTGILFLDLPTKKNATEFISKNISDSYLWQNHNKKKEDSKKKEDFFSLHVENEEKLESKELPLEQSINVNGNSSEKNENLVSEKDGSVPHKNYIMGNLELMTEKQLQVIKMIQINTGKTFFDVPTKENATAFISEHIEESMQKGKKN